MSVMTEDRDIEMCKSFNLKKLALQAEYCIVGIPHIQPCSLQMERQVVFIQTFVCYKFGNTVMLYMLKVVRRRLLQKL